MFEVADRAQQVNQLLSGKNNSDRNETSYNWRNTTRPACAVGRTMLETEAEELKKTPSLNDMMGRRITISVHTERSVSDNIKESNIFALQTGQSIDIEEKLPRSAR
jgi:hypothetical protein